MTSAQYIPATIDRLIFVDDWLKPFLNIHKIKQSEVAREIYLDPSIVQLWASGKRSLPWPRVEALAVALSHLSETRVTGDLILEWSRIEGGSVLPPYLRAVPPPVVVPPPEPAEPGPPAIPVSAYPLAWCESTHGTGVRRRHHHGPAASWKPGALLDATRWI